jgi:excisionase family DNA binding protein
MQTLNLQEAAALLHLHPTTLAAKARAGEIPGARLGKRWVFVEVDLLDYVRSQYPSRALQGDSMEVSTCHSTNAKTRRIGGSRSPTKADAYSKALGLPIEGRPRSTTTS